MNSTDHVTKKLLGTDATQTSPHDLGRPQEHALLDEPLITPDAPTRLVCHICGATTSRRGRLFENRADLLRHLRSSHRDVPLGADGEFLNAPVAPSPSLYPVMHSRSRAKAPREKLPETMSAHAKFCPACGCNLSVINAALTFAAEHEAH